MTKFFFRENLIKVLSKFTVSLKQRAILLSVFRTKNLTIPKHQFSTKNSSFLVMTGLKLTMKICNEKMHKVLLKKIIVNGISVNFWKHLQNKIQL